MNIRLKLLVVMLAMPLLGLSCGDSDVYVVKGVKVEGVSEINSEWAKLNGMSGFSCSEYHLDKAIPESCFRNGEKNKVPATVTWVEMLDTQDAKVILMFRSGKTEHKQLLSESLRKYINMEAECVGEPV